MRISRRIALLLAALIAPGPASAVAFGELFDAVPAPPATVALAQAWLENGELVAPQVLGTQARLEAARQKLKADATVSSSPEAVDAAMAAWERYRASTDGQAAGAVLASRTQWLLKRFATLQKRTSNPEQTQHLREQELSAYATLYQSWKQERAPIIWLAQSKLNAAGSPASIDTLSTRETLEEFSRALLAESEALLGLTRLAAERANGYSEPEIDPSAVNQPSTLWDLMSNPDAD